MVQCSMAEYNTERYSEVWSVCLCMCAYVRLYVPICMHVYACMSSHVCVFTCVRITYHYACLLVRMRSIQYVAYDVQCRAYIIITLYMHMPIRISIIWILICNIHLP